MKITKGINPPKKQETTPDPWVLIAQALDGERGRWILVEDPPSTDRGEICNKVLEALHANELLYRSDCLEVRLQTEGVYLKLYREVVKPPGMDDDKDA